jgi:hypothetical protein
MTSHYKYYSEAPEIVPFTASYPAPSQAIKSYQTTVKIPPKNANVFNPGDKIRIEFPPSGYLNARETYLQFDVTVTASTTTMNTVRFQQGIQSIFDRITTLYGGLPLEDTMEQGGIARILLETGVGRSWSESSGPICEGVSITMVDHEPILANSATVGEIVPQSGIASGNIIVSGEQTLQDLAGALAPTVSGTTVTSAAGVQNTRRYCVLPNSGVLSTEKNWPLQWLASQVAVEFYLAPAAKCMVVDQISGQTAAPTYQITNVNMVCNLLTFSDAYDQAFEMALNGPSGVPIKFNAFGYYTLNLTGSSNTLQVQTRHRSIKSVFAVMRDQSYTFLTDSGLFFFDAGLASAGSGTAGSTVSQYQWRIGGRYYPSQPVDCRYGAAEAYMELQKALNTLGDYSVGTRISHRHWSTYGQYTVAAGPGAITGSSQTVTTANGNAGNKFIMAVELETSNGYEVSGINGEEQSDIALMVTLNGAPIAKRCDVYVHYDALAICRAGNVMELID